MLTPHQSQYTRLLAFLSELSEAKIHFDLSSVRDDAIMIHFTVPGERCEIEFMKSGAIETEIFKSDGIIHDESPCQNF
jgi:hypothetical protein